MSGSRAYLDWNATAPLRPEARAAMLEAMDLVGNPSSVHAEGRAARGLVERARAVIAGHLGARPGEVVFTSGATEAASVLAGFAAVDVDPGAHDAVWAWNRPGDGAIRAVGLANSETGEIVQAEAGPGGLLLDVTQAVGRMPFAFGWSGADFALLSAHKFGGPKGVGVLIVREGREMPPLQPGGGQEMNRRAGTENLIGIAGAAAALTAAMKEQEDGAWDRVAGLRDLFEARVADEVPEVIFAAKERARLSNTSCLILPGWKGETQVMAMDLAGFAISAGSACSSGKLRPSRVLRAMGYGETEAASAIRVSLGASTPKEDVMRFAAAWIAAAKRHVARAA